MRRSYEFIQNAARYFRSHIRPHVVVLMYHRVTDLPIDPHLITVTPQHFQEHLEVLRRFARPISLKALHANLQQDRVPRRGVVLTFDDGYIDNLTNARPFLEQYEIPATFFITAGHLDCQEEFWWDQLEQLLLHPGEIPSSLALMVSGRYYQWNIPGADQYTEEDYQRCRDWDLEMSTDPSPRHTLYRSLYTLMHSLQEAERCGVIAEIQAWVGKEVVCRPNYRTLKPDELIALADTKLVEVGAHTMTHPALANLPVSGQREEIAQGRQRLEAVLDRPVHSFSYPHGSYTEETLTIVRETGFTCACSSDTNVVQGNSDPFRLPRYVARNWNGDEFQRWLNELISW